MEVWFSEDQTPDMRLSVRVRRVLHHETTPYQEIMVLDTVQFGRMLVLDDIIQTTEFEEFTYHEMMAHVPLFAHPHPERVLVVGGGDGGVIREVLKHPTVREAHLAEIDERVIAVSRQYLPTISSALDDPRCRILVTDGIRHVAESPDTYDVIIVDSTDPIGPAVGLFSEDFYRSVYRALRRGGLFVAQTESPFYNRDVLGRVQEILSRVFPRSGLYLAVVPGYPGGLWALSYGSKGPDPRRVPPERWRERGFERFGTRYYSPAIHAAAFALPPFVAELVPRGRGGDGAEPGEAGDPSPLADGDPAPLPDGDPAPTRTQPQGTGPSLTGSR